MVPKIHAKGHSFKGAATYVLHDKDKATTDHRVEWTHTLNMATEDAHVGWRVMAATAMDQEMLKEAAGVKKTGRKSTQHVLHYTLSWHADEAEGLTKDEMLRAVEGSLEALGRPGTDEREGQLASEHQAIVVCHNDEPQPHVHVIVNRVHPEHGVMLPSSNDRLALSRWAEGYEKERGKVLCEQRVKNNEARDNRQYVKGEPSKPRHIYELEQKYKDHPDRDRIIAEQRRRDRELSGHTRRSREQRAAEWKKLRESHRAAKEAIREQTRKRMREAAKKVREDFTPEWKKLYRNQRRALYEFGQREKHFMGRIRNALSTVTLRSIMHGENRGAVLTELFKAITSQGVRLGALEKVHVTATKRLQAREGQARERAIQRQRDIETKKLANLRKQFAASREQLSTRHEVQRAEISNAWRARRLDRRNAWMEKVAERDFNAASQTDKKRKGRTERRGEDRRLARDEQRRRKRQPRGRDRGPDDGRTR